MRCPKCGAPLKPRKVSFSYGRMSLGLFDGAVCRNQHSYYTDVGSKEIERVAKENGIWGKKEVT